jgi:superfamily II DNA or RNA helicase
VFNGDERLISRNEENGRRPALGLRAYQVDAVEQIEAALATDKRVLFVLPTGGGKTVVAATIIERAVERGERVLVLTHRREILKQTSLKLSIDHGIIQAGLNADLISGAGRQHSDAACTLHTL